MLAKQHVDLIGKVIWGEFRTHPAKGNLYSAGYDGLLKAERKYKPERGKFRSFAWVLIRNAVVDYLRKENRNRLSSADLFEPDVAGEQTSVEDQEMVETLLEEVPEELREIVLLKIGHGLTYREIMERFPEWKQTKLVQHIEKAMKKMQLRARQMA